MLCRLNLWKSQLEKHDTAYTYGILRMEDRKRFAPGQHTENNDYKIPLRIPKTYSDLIDKAKDDDTLQIEYERVDGLVAIQNVTVKR